jgi:hypothetical protein
MTENNKIEIDVRFFLDNEIQLEKLSGMLDISEFSYGIIKEKRFKEI